MMEYIELLGVLLGMPGEEDIRILEDRLYEVYGISLDGFEWLIDSLLPMINIGEDPLSKNMYKGFSEDGRLWLAKTLATI